MLRWITCRRYHMHNCSTLSEMNDKGENIITQIPGGLFQSSKPSGNRPHKASVSVYDLCGEATACKRPHEIAWQAVFLAKLTYFLLKEGRKLESGRRFKGIVNPEMKFCWKFTHPQVIQVCFFIGTDLALHHLLTNGSSAVNGCRQYENILARSNSLKLKHLNNGFVSNKHTAFRFTRQ